MIVEIKASFDKNRSKDVALLLAEIIKANVTQDKLEIAMKSGTISFLCSLSDDLANFVDVKSILDIMTDIEVFKYTATPMEVTENSKVTASIGVLSSDKAETAKKNPTEKNNIPMKYRILELMEKYPDDSEGINASYFCEVLGLDRKKAACHLTSLLRDGKIEKVSRGFYRVVRKKSDASAENRQMKVSTEDTEGSVTKESPVSKMNQSTENPNYKRYKELSEVPFFAEIDSMIDFKLSREENIKNVLNILYRMEEPAEIVKNDLYVRATVAVTLVPERLDFDKIDANLEDYDTGVSEKSKKLTEEYLIKVFALAGYTTTYLKFLKSLNDQFMQRYKDPNWPFTKKVQEQKLPKTVKIANFPENEEFEIFLGQIAEQKTSGSKVMEKVVDYMDPNNIIKGTIRNDVYEAFRVAYSLKRISSDYIFVNGNFINSQKKIEEALMDLVYNFVHRIAPEEMARIRYIVFLKNLIEALRKA